MKLKDWFVAVIVCAVVGYGLWAIVGWYKQDSDVKSMLTTCNTEVRADGPDSGLSDKCQMLMEQTQAYGYEVLRHPGYRGQFFVEYNPSAN